MAEYSGSHVLNTPAGTITFNQSGATSCVHDPESCTGLDGISGPLRTTTDPAPLTRGRLKHTTFPDGRPITLAGRLNIVGAGDDPAYATARNALEQDLAEALDSILNIAGTYVWTPTGLSARTLTVYHDSVLSITGANFKSYLFGLIAPDPVWT